MTLSIIIPIYNGSQFLSKLKHTIEQFTFKDFEIIFIDNNSKDDSVQKIKELFDDVNFKWSLLKEEKQGAGYARNAGIAHAKGKYLAFLDCDDVILPGKFELDMAIFTRHKEVDFVFCRAERIYEDGRRIKPPIRGISEGINLPPNLGMAWLQNYFRLQGPGSLVAKKRIIESLGGFHTSKTGEDAFLFIKLGLGHTGYFYNQSYYQYFRHSESTISVTNKKDSHPLIRYLELRKNLFSDPFLQRFPAALNLLSRQIQIDLLKLHCSGENIKQHLNDNRLECYIPSKVLFNPVSMMINKLVPKIKYNPFYQYYMKSL